jgi:phosphatidylserine/phosphatidylglycerophosphate/cardiolipin synthase-like enzyme
LRNFPLSAALAGTLVALLAVGCSSRLVAPKTDYGYKGIERAYGAAIAPTPDGELKAVTPLDPDARTPLLTQTMAVLDKLDPEHRYRGITYDLSHDNQLAAGWLQQTPDAWGKRAGDVPFVPAGCPYCDAAFQLPACTRDSDCATGRCGHLKALETGAPARAKTLRCLGHSEQLLDAIYDVIVNAESAVDIAVLDDLPDIRFLATLRNALTALAYSGRPVTVRLIAGQYPTGEADTDEFLERLTHDARRVEGSHLYVYVGAVRSCAGQSPCDSFSWSHAKIIAADGRVALVGGHNMWTRDYLMNAPVHDISMVLRGSAVADTDHFLDELWAFTCARKGTSRSNAYRFDHPWTDDGCLPHLTVPPPRRGPGHITVMSIARLAAGITPDFANQGDIAELLMLGAAKHVIRTSQQDLGFSLGHIAEPVWPEAILAAFADLIANKRGDVYVVLSQPGAESAGGNAYSTGVSLEQVVRKLRAVVHDRAPTLSDPELDALVCQHFHLAPLRFGPDDAWPGGLKIANHAKLWTIDDRAFHIGSHNFYPVDLQEFGYIVEDRNATAALLKDYWEPLWRASSRAAVSGSDAPRCLLDKSAPAS